ncbi:MAG: hypothetical protein IT536_12830 [Hyphomicrobiales bacterium]|nr:hypothetical protein [Hyphomicrobiales bacterium]
MQRHSLGFWGHAILGLIVLVGFFFATLFLSGDPALQIGEPVQFSLAVSKKPDVCVQSTGRIVFWGRVCSVDERYAAVQWEGLANAENSEPLCGPHRIIRWDRAGKDPKWIAMYVGACGIRPNYFEDMPSRFDPRTLKRARNLDDLVPR